MYRFSLSSQQQLQSCHPRLQQLFNTVIQHMDCTILEGFRNEIKQARLLKQGKSRVKHSKHQDKMAIDVAPYPIDWQDLNRFYYFAGFVLGTAVHLNIAIRWGGDWNQNHQFNDQHFNDLVHFELQDE